MENKTINRRVALMIGFLFSIVFIMPAQNASAADAQQAPQETITISGVVTDDLGAAVPGASVVVKGTNNGTTTNVNGEYSLRVPANASLLVSFIGTEPKEIAVAGKTYIPVQLLLDEGIQMEQVVVTALGVKRSERALGYAAQNVSGTALQTVKGVDAGSSLTGKVAGLVVKNSTEFNAQSTMEMRGENALLVINGVPYGNMTLRDIPSDEIESISMLKGATASALYGMRGMGGAIMITTKGKGKQGLTVDVNSNTMFNAGYTALPEMQSKYGRGENGVLGNDYTWGPYLDGKTIVNQWDGKTKQYMDKPLTSSGGDNLKNFMETGLVTNNSIAVTQTGELGFFRVSANHVYNKGQFPNQKLNITNISVAGRIETKKLKVDAQMGYGRTTAPQMYGYGYDNQGYVYQLIMWTGADYDIRDYKDYWVTPDEKQNWLYNGWYDNPYMIAYEKLHTINNNKINTSINATYDILPNLSVTARLGYDFFKDEDELRNPVGCANSTRGPNIMRLPSTTTYKDWSYSPKGFYGVNQNWGNSFNGDFMINYNETFGKFNLDVMGGGSIFWYNLREQGAKTLNGLAVSGWYSLNNAVPSTAAGVDNVQTNVGEAEQQVNSLYGKVSLSWNDAVYLDITGRNDWCSTQPKDEMSYFYPSVAASVIPTQFFHAPDWLSMWKLRASWTMAKTPAGVYANNMPYTTSTQWGNKSASLPTALAGSTGLLPTTTRTWEFGTAAYFFGRRLHVDVAYFSKLFYNQQVSQAVAYSSGYKTKLINSDETFARRGYEITVSGSPVKTKTFEWQSMVNIASHHSYYVDIDEEFSAKNGYVKPGKRVDYMLADRMCMYDPAGNRIIAANGNVQFDTYKRLAGYSDPKFTFGWSNTFTLNNWSLGFSFDGRIGGTMDNYIFGKMFDTGSAPETDTKWRYDEVINGGKYVAKGVKVVSGNVTYDTQGRITSDDRVYATNDIPVSYQAYMKRWGNSNTNRMRDASFFKLRELYVSYSFPKQWFGRSGINNLSVALTGQNLLLWTKDFKYSDPDRGKEDMNSPSQRMIGFDVKIGF